MQCTQLFGCCAGLVQLQSRLTAAQLLSVWQSLLQVLQDDDSEVRSLACGLVLGLDMVSNSHQM